MFLLLRKRHLQVEIKVQGFKRIINQVKVLQTMSVVCLPIMQYHTLKLLNRPQKQIFLHCCLVLHGSVDSEVGLKAKKQKEKWSQIMPSHLNTLWREISLPGNYVFAPLTWLLVIFLTSKRVFRMVNAMLNVHLIFALNILYYFLLI